MKNSTILIDVSIGGVFGGIFIAFLYILTDFF